MQSTTEPYNLNIDSTGNTYLFDSYSGDKTIDFKQIVKVSAAAIAKYCNGFEACLISPKQGIKEKTKSGKLPQKPDDRKKFVEDLCDWIFEKSDRSDQFKLRLYEKFSVSNKERVGKFDHHDDTCCWLLHLTPQEFKELQAELIKNKLPADLFYHESKSICLTFKPKFKSKFLSRLIAPFTDYQQCFSPKQWRKMESRVPEEKFDFLPSLMLWGIFLIPFLLVISIILIISRMIIRIY